MNNATIGRTILARAYDYVMYCAGRGADAPTLNSYLTLLNDFLPAWTAWASPISQSALVSTIPMLPKLVPSLVYSSGNPPFTPTSSNPLPDLIRNFDAILEGPPPAVTSAVTLALQHYMLIQAGEGSGQQLPIDLPLTQVGVLTGLLARTQRIP